MKYFGARYFGAKFFGSGFISGAVGAVFEYIIFARRRGRR